MNKYLDTKPDYIKCKSLWDAYDFLAHLKWQYLKAEQDGKEHLYYIDDVQISLVHEEFHEDQWANIRWSYHTEKIELVLKRIENDKEVTYACSSLAYEKNQSDFSIYSFMHEHLLSLPDAEDIVSVYYQNMIPVTRSEDVSMPETDCTNDAEEPTLPKAEETKKANPNTVGNLSFKEFKDYMCQDKILNETKCLCVASIRRLYLIPPKSRH